ncbi:MAG: glycosyltransferase family 4 protein [Actinobacteria bacterium]|nr:MAG: glycosyltransferase family 4 protein [Actinomycetota bacterium]
MLTRRSKHPLPASPGLSVRRVLPVKPDQRGRGGRALDAAWHARSLRATRRIVEAARPDVIATWGTYGISPAALSNLYGCGVPSIAFVQDYTLIEHLTQRQPDAGGGAVRRRYAGALRALAPLAWPPPPPGRWVFPSGAVREEYLRALGPLEARVIHNGIAVPSQPPPLPERGPRLRVGALGRLVPEKGWLTLVSAAESLAREDPTTAPIVEIHGPAVDAGFVGALVDASARANAAGALVEVGDPLPHEAIAPFMERMDCVAIPSEWAEPFAVVMLEALAAGRPIVGTSCGGAADLLEDGNTALLHEPGDASGCARALRRLAREPRLADRISAAGLERLRAECSIDLTAPAIDDALREAAGG